MGSRAEFQAQPCTPNFKATASFPWRDSPNASMPRICKRRDTASVRCLTEHTAAMRKGGVGDARRLFERRASGIARLRHHTTHR